MFRGKIDRGLFSVSFIRESIQRHSAALRPYFPDFLALADGFARQCDPSLSTGRYRLQIVHRPAVLCHGLTLWPLAQF